MNNVKNTTYEYNLVIALKDTLYEWRQQYHIPIQFSNCNIKTQFIIEESKLEKKIMEKP